MHVAPANAGTIVKLVALVQVTVSIAELPAPTVVGVKLIVTVGSGRGFTVTIAVADLVESATEVAVTVTARGDPVTVGAV